MRDPVDVITARALRYGLDPSFRSERAAPELAELAEHRRFGLERAMRRVERASLSAPAALAGAHGGRPRRPLPDVIAGRHRIPTCASRAAVPAQPAVEALATAV